jgi:hypothetical protein
MMMQVPRGITGFYTAKDPPLPTFAVQDFTTIGYAVARSLGATVIHRDLHPHAARSYSILILQAGHERWSLLGHAIHPIIASVAEAINEYVSSRPFADLPSLAAIAPDFGVTTYPAQFLNHAVDPRWLTNLAAVEMREIRGWKPQRMGDIIFNFWD